MNNQTYNCKRKILIFLFLFFVALPAVAGEPRPFVFQSSSQVFEVGEELTYNVSYATFDIGQVRVKVTGKEEVDGKTLYRATANIDSYKGVPFVDLHAVYQSLMFDDVHAHRFNARTKESDRWWEVSYDFDYAKKAVFVDQGVWKSGKIEKRDTLKIDTLHQDGLSLFFLARTQVMTKQHVEIPTIVTEKKGTTYIDYEVKRESEEIDAVDYPVDVVYFSGEAGFVGIFGLTGGFEGWFSNDEARVPIIAKMKVLLGNIRIELMKWKRGNWQPPRAQED